MSSTSGRGPDLARASARSAAKVWTALLVAILAMIAGTNDAYATTTWISASDGSGDDGYIGIVWPYDYPNGRVKALAEFLHFDWDSFSTQTQDDILASHDGQGAFKVLLDHNVKNYRYENTELGFYPSNPVSYVQEKMYSLGAATSMFGNDKFWYIACTDEMYQLAIQNVEEFLYPNDGTGSEGGNEPTGDFDIGTDFTIYYNNNGRMIQNLSTIVVRVTDAQRTAINTYVNGTGITNKLVYASLRYGSNEPICLYCVDANNYEYGSYIRNNTEYPHSLISNTGATGFNGVKFYGSVSNGVYNGSGSVTSYSRNSSYGVIYDTYGGLVGGGNVVEPDPYEPTPDPEPTKPSIQIGDVTIDLSNGPVTYNDTTYSVVYAPDNSWSVTVETNNNNTYGGDVTASDPTDYTSILNAILAAINAFRQEVNGFNNQINSNITTAINSINNSIKNVETTIVNNLNAFKSQIHMDIQTLQSNIQDTIKKRWNAFAEDLWSNMGALDSDIIEELYKDAKYIVDSMDFGSEFSDKDIISWLKRIYQRLSNKKVTVPSVDDDPKGWLDGLNDILDALLDMILSGLNVATLATLFEGLKVRFPISIPWDIAAIVNMFAGGAVTPEFDLPLYKGDGTLQSVHVDLSEWDDEMALVRQGELLLFGIALMMNSKWLFDTMTMSFKRGE